MKLDGLAGSIGKGLIAGFAGMAAMTISSTLEAKLRGREPSDAPARAAATVLGIKEFSSDEAKARFSNIVHWSYGTGWGAVRGLLAFTGLSPTAADVGHFAAVWGNAAVMLPTLGVAPPFWMWGKTEVAIDVFHHLVYVAATSVAYAALES